MLGTFAGALAARRVQFSDLSAETAGEVENKVLVIKRIIQTFRLAAKEGDKETVELVLGVYDDSCPVARSVRGLSRSRASWS